MFTNSKEREYLIQVFTNKIRRGDSNPIVMQNERDKNKYLIITPVFNKNKFLIDAIETEITIQEKDIPLPRRNIREMIIFSKQILNRGKDMLRKLAYDLEIFDHHIGEPREIFLGIDDKGCEIWRKYEYWKRVI